VTESGSVGVGPAPSEVVRGMAGSVMSMAPSDGVVVVRALSTLSPSSVSVGVGVLAFHWSLVLFVWGSSCDVWRSFLFCCAVSHSAGSFSVACALGSPSSSTFTLL